MPGFSKWFLSLRIPHENPVYASPIPIRAIFPAHLILDFISPTVLGKENRLLSYSLCNFLHSPVTSSFLGTNIFLSTLFSNTLILPSSLSVSDQVSHPYSVSLFRFLWSYRLKNFSSSVFASWLFTALRKNEIFTAMQLNVLRFVVVYIVPDAPWDCCVFIFRVIPSIRPSCLNCRLFHVTIDRCAV